MSTQYFNSLEKNREVKKSLQNGSVLHKKTKI